MTKEQSGKNGFNIHSLINFAPRWLIVLLGSILLVFLVFKFIGIDLSVVGNRFIEQSITEDTSVKKDELSIYTEVHPPYNYHEGSDAKGIAIDLLKAMFYEMNVDFNVTRIQFMDWDAAYEITKAKNNTLLFTMGRTESREGLFKWVGPIGSETDVLIGRKSGNIKIDRISDIKKYKVGVVAKTLGAQHLKEKGVGDYYLEISTAHDTNIYKLIRGKIDLIAVPQSFGFEMIAKKGLNVDDYETVYELAQVGWYYAFNKGVSDERIEDFQNALDVLKRTGQYEKILRKYNK